MMFSSPRSPASAYHRLGVETAVQLADPHRLVELLYDGAIVAIGKARIALSNEDVAGKGEHTSRAIRIIDEGLKASLDPVGGDLTTRLESLYDYMNRALVQANLGNDDRRFAEVEQLLGDLRGAWRQIRPSPARDIAKAVAA